MINLEQVSEGVAMMTLNNPSMLNPLSLEMANAIEASSLSVSERFPSLRVLIITGAGRAFSSGGSFKYLEERVNTKSSMENAHELYHFYCKFMKLRNRLEDVAIIAAVNGPAVGGGLGLSLACDIRLASKQAYFAANFCQLGIASGAGSSFVLPQIVGHQFATYMLLTGERVPAEVALQHGLVLEVLENQQALLERSKNLAASIARGSSTSIRLILESLRNQTASHIEEALLRDAHDQAISFSGPDILEGIQAAKEHRKPQFKH